MGGNGNQCQVVTQLAGSENHGVVISAFKSVAQQMCLHQSINVVLQIRVDSFNNLLCDGLN
jgi:hypothetical protein